MDGAFDTGPAQHGAGRLEGCAQGLGIAVLLDGLMNTLDGALDLGLNHPITGAVIETLTMALEC